MNRTGVVIAAASRRVARPVTRLGGISLIQRLVLTFHKAGIQQIVVVTGFEDPEIKAQLTNEGVVFVQLPDYEDPELIESFRHGLNYLRGRCPRIFLTPVNTPMFTYATVRALAGSSGQIVIPSFRGRAGHPVLVAEEIVPDIHQYQGERGLAGFIRSSHADRRWIAVNDPGILPTVHQPEILRELLPAHDQTLIQPWWSLGIRKTGVIFDTRTLLLLRLLDETHSMSGACRIISLSLSKAWRMVNALERDLGFRVVIRSQGGSHGGRTRLSEEGKVLVTAYAAYQERVARTVEAGYQDFWAAIEPLMTPGELPGAEDDTTTPL